MSKSIQIDLPERSWKEYHIQGIKGIIVSVNGKYQIEVEVMELPGETVYYDFVCPFEINDALLGKLVFGDINKNGFNIIAMCLIDN